MSSIMKVLEDNIYYCIYQVNNDNIYHDNINNKMYVGTKYGVIYISFKYLMNYFVCPDCQRLYKQLYLVDNEIKCRKCHNLYYASELYNKW
jgi:hypothetical protein